MEFWRWARRSRMTRTRTRTRRSRMTVPVRPKNVGVWGAAVSAAVLHLLVFGPVTPCHGVEQPSDDADDAGTQTVIDSSRRFGLNQGTEKSGGSTLVSLENDVVVMIIR